MLWSYAIGSNLRRLREDRKISQAELGRRLGRSQATVSAWERGIPPADEDQIPQIASALGVSVAALIAIDPAGPYDSEFWPEGSSRG